MNDSSREDRDVLSASWERPEINPRWHNDALAAGCDPYNPLAESNVARSVQAAILSVPTVSLGNVPAFYGSGIYVLYYSGDNLLYKPVAEIEWPIYVGKASPEGVRKGATRAKQRDKPQNELDELYGRALWRRLREHAKSIDGAADLRISDFSCRYLVTTSAFVGMSESLMIDWFTPVWNQVTDGFGNHDPGSGRRAGRIPRWDVLHPGRGWANKHTPASEIQRNTLVEAVAIHFRDNPPRPGQETAQAALRRAITEPDFNAEADVKEAD
jgi:hypothetical protein